MIFIIIAAGYYWQMRMDHDRRGKYIRTPESYVSVFIEVLNEESQKS